MKPGEIYKKRVVDDLLAKKLEGVGAVLVEGPKWCGKTTTCEQLAKSVLYMADPDTLDRHLAQAETNIKDLLKGEQPRLIDEWQVAPKFWDAVRFAVDHEAGWGHYILTGSAVPPEKKGSLDGHERNQLLHTGTGRIVRIRMRPMSLWESGESTGSVSLGDLFSGRFDLGECMSRSLEDIAYLVCRGGWPQAVGQTGGVALEALRSF